MARGNIGRAVVPIYDANNCITGWAVQTVAEESGSSGEITSDLSVVHPSGGRTLFTTITGINDIAPKVIIPDDDATDVKQHVFIQTIVTTNNPASNYAEFSLVQGGTMTQNVIASSTYRFRLNADGSVDVIRTAGFDNGRAVIWAMWW